jgi:hypothetical protein
MTGTIPAHALYFFGYESGKKFVNPYFGENNAIFGHFLAGLWADVCGAIIWCPMDVIKQRLQIQRKSGKYTGSFQALQYIAREEGLRGLYRGYGAALATYAPFVGIYFATYEKMKKELHLKFPGNNFLVELSMNGNLYHGSCYWLQVVPLLPADLALQ